MKHFLTRLLALALILCRLGIANAQAEDLHNSPVDPAQQLVLVMLRLPPQHFRPDESYAGSYLDDSARAARRRVARDMATRYGLRLRDQWPMPVIGVDCFLMEKTDDTPLEKVLEALKLDPRVTWAQPLGEYHALDAGDPLYRVQPAAETWHLADLHRFSTGRNVTIAVIDSGVDTAHPDLVGQIALRRNFVDDVLDGSEAHGTAVAGIIAARKGNGLGIAGVAPQSRLMALRACWESNGRPTQCNSFTLGKAINFALENGANIINLSLAGPPDRLLQSLIEVALTRGVTVIGAADPARLDGGFPASQPGVIAVMRNEDRHSSTLPIVVAPGTDIPTSLPGSRWGLVSGSSYAAAHVTGFVALLAELHPRAWPEEVRHQLEGASPSAPAAQGVKPRNIDTCAVLARAVNACICSCSQPSTATKTLR